MTSYLNCRFLRTNGAPKARLFLSLPRECFFGAAHFPSTKDLNPSWESSGNHALPSTLPPRASTAWMWAHTAAFFSPCLGAVVGPASPYCSK